MKCRCLLAAIGLTASLTAVADNRVPFNGLILDSSLQPVNKVKVYVNDPNRFARSDKKGRFGLTNVQPTDTIILEVPKMPKVRIPVEGRKSLKVIIDKSGLPSAEEDEELVNTGYGYVKRREYTISSSGISGEALRRSGSTSLLEALNGMVAGLSINRENGRLVPNIRGVRSLKLSNEPLYIIDGIEVGSLEHVNIFEIDHVEVLKEASIYGARGANGAIVVTTIHFKR